jgi:hypothetical protein
MSQYDAMGLGKALNELYGLEHGRHSHRTPEELGCECGLDTLLLKQFQNLVFELRLGDPGSPGGEVESDVFVHPDPAAHILVEQHHLATHVKSAKTVKQPFEADQRLLHQVEGLEQRHPGQRVEGGGEVLNGHLHHRALVDRFPREAAVEEHLHDGELCPAAPLDDPQFVLSVLAVQDDLVFLEGTRAPQGRGRSVGAAAQVP